MTKLETAILGTTSLVLAILMAGCGNKDDAPASGPPGPVVGSPTPGGGAVTVTPAVGRKPHMAGKPITPP